MTKTIHLEADDGSLSVEVTAKLTPREGAYQPSELKSAKLSLARALADGLRGMSYTDFGPENIRVRL